MTTNNFIPYARQTINAADISAVSHALEKPIITRGQKVEEFERAIADYCQARYAVAFCNATAGLQAAYFAAELGPYDKVFSSPNTYVASIGPYLNAKANPIFIDIDRNTGNIDLNLLEGNLHTQMSRGRNFIIPVHFSGIPVDMEKLDSLCYHNSIVIEDAAHAIGSSYADGQKVGCCAWSQMTVFSFHPAKNMTTGEGGMVTTNDENLYRRLIRFRDNGIERNPKYFEGPEAQPWSYEVQDITGNYHLTAFQAALGISQLKRLDRFVSKRRDIVNWYRTRLKDLPFIRLFSADYDARTAYHLFVVQIDYKACKTSRNRVIDALLDRGIGTQVHYIPLYHHPFFKRENGDISEFFPEMNAYYEQTLTLPLYPDLKESDIERICEALKKIVM